MKEQAFSCFQLKYFLQTAWELNHTVARVLSVNLFRSGLKSCSEKCGGSVRVFSMNLIRFRQVLFSLSKMRCSVWVMSPVICLSNCYEPSDSSMHVTLPCSQMAREGPHSAAASICLFKTNGTIEFTSCVHKQLVCSQKYLPFSDKLPQQSLSVLAFINFVNAWDKTNRSV